MAFNTTSFLAGVGSVVVVLSTGFAGGYFFASPDHNVPPNRLQRVAASTTDTKAADANAAPAATVQAKPEIVAAAPLAPPAQAAEPAQASTTPAAQSSAPAAPTPGAQQAIADQSAPTPAPQPQVAAKTEEPAHAAPDRTTAQASSEKTNADKLGAEKEKSDREQARIADAKALSRKRAEAKKFAEQQRRQRELEVAAGAVRHIIHDRDGDEIIVRDAPPPPDVVEVDQAEPPAPDVRPFNFFGR